MTFKPIISIELLVLIFVLLFAGSVYLVAKNRSSVSDRIYTLIRLSIIYILAFIIGLRPVMVETRYEFATKNLDVLFVVDNTISMWAQDYNGRKERMKGVVADARIIIDELAGSNFGLVTFDDSSHVLSPFTQDMQHIKDLFDTFKSPDSYYARGSDLSRPYKDIEALLLSSSRKENRKTIVFYMSDGEITNGTALKDYSELSQYIDAGAVLGYGTLTGGKMSDTYGYDYVYDYSEHQDAISRIDEENLGRIAEDLGLTYMNMNSGNAALRGAVEVIKESSKTVIETGDGAEIQNDIYYFFAIPLALMMLLELVFIVRRGRL